MLYLCFKVLIYGGNMPFRKVLIFTVFAVVLGADANAIKVNDYSITLTDDPKLDEIYKKDEYRAMASEVLRQHYNAHMAKVRMNNKSELVQWDNETYNESVYCVILNEIARCFFNIENGMVKYNQFNGRMIECIKTSPSNYNAANWNYVFLINLIDRFMANTIKPFYDTQYKKLFDRALKDTREVILNAKRKDGYMCDYATYAEAIERAYGDIKEYCDQLQLSDYLTKLMKARLNQANIKYKAQRYTTQDKNGNKVEKEDRSAELTQYKDFITEIDKSPKDNNSKAKNEFESNKWIQMTLSLPGISRMQTKNHILENSDAYYSNNLPNATTGGYHERFEERIYIDEPAATPLFKTYRMVFGKVTAIAQTSTTKRDIRNPKYIKLSDNRWDDRIQIVIGYPNSEYEYEGFHPLERSRELFIPNYYNSIYKRDKKIDNFGNKMINSYEQEALQRIANFKMINRSFINAKAKYVHTNASPDFRTNMRLIYKIPDQIQYTSSDLRLGKKVMNNKDATTYEEKISNLKKELQTRIDVCKKRVNEDPTPKNIQELRILNYDLERTNLYNELTEHIAGKGKEKEEAIQRYKQYETIMIVAQLITGIVDQIKKINEETIGINTKSGSAIYLEIKEFTKKISDKIKKLKTATNMLPTYETIDKASKIILNILGINGPTVDARLYLWEKLKGEYSLEDEQKLTDYRQALRYYGIVEDKIIAKLNAAAQHVLTDHHRLRNAYDEANLYQSVLFKGVRIKEESE